MGSFSHNRKIPASRGGNASFFVPETLSLRDPSTFSTRRRAAGRFRSPAGCGASNLRINPHRHKNPAFAGVLLWSKT
jgi:hypothetical protein